MKITRKVINFNKVNQEIDRMKKELQEISEKIKQNL